MLDTWLLNPHKYHKEKGTIFINTLQRKSETERLSDLAKIIQLISGIAEIPTQTAWLQIPYPGPQGLVRYTTT